MLAMNLLKFHFRFCKVTAPLALVFLLGLSGCSSKDRYFVGQARFLTPHRTDPLDSNAWVAISIKVAPDGKANVKYGAMGGVTSGTGSLNGTTFNGSVPLSGGTITLNGNTVSAPEVGTGIDGTITRSAGESGEFTVVEKADGQQVYDLY
jgi:hypothetical protein